MQITPIDMASWPRAMHYKYYTEAIQAGYSVTFRADVTRILSYCRRKDRRFYGCMLYAISRAVNRLDFMRMVRMEDGNPGIWDQVCPIFTVFHKDTETFSDLWMDYDPDPDRFYAEYERVMDRYGHNHGVKGREHQPPNFFCVSCVPWLDFTGYAASTPEPAQFFPIIAYGRYTEQDGRVSLPVSVTISHAAADGYHIYLFQKALQEEMDRFSGLLTDC